jgi:hypothetical protein
MTMAWMVMRRRAWIVAHSNQFFGVLNLAGHLSSDYFPPRR